MAIEIKIPSLGESITEVQIASWLVKEGDTVTKDQNLVSIESEKATVEVPAPEAGVVSSILQTDGATVKVGDVIAHLETAGGKASSKAAKKSTDEPRTAEKPAEKKESKAESAAPKKKEKAEPAPAPEPEPEPEAKEEPASEPEAKEEPKPAPAPAKPAPAPAPQATTSKPAGSRVDETKPMTLLRRTVAKRLLDAQQSMAILSTFNEIDMSAVIALRKQYQESFVAKSGVKLGFMSFFVKAVIEALKSVPQLNAEIRGNDIVYHHYFDIGVAIGAGKGLVVPPVRNAETMSFAEIEKAIADLGSRAKENRLKPQELEGGTFTITNGGVYGSLLSTPIINPPQSGILGLHSMQERPVARAGQVVIRPMMYMALSYDHRIVDGREAVQFLVRVKELIEDPTRLLLEV